MLRHSYQVLLSFLLDECDSKVFFSVFFLFKSFFIVCENLNDGDYSRHNLKKKSTRVIDECQKSGLDKLRVVSLSRSFF